MKWTELDFGRYRGKTLPQVLFTDPDWFLWAVEEGAFRSKPGLAEEAELRARCAQPTASETACRTSAQGQRLAGRAPLPSSTMTTGFSSFTGSGPRREPGAT